MYLSATTSTRYNFPIQNITWTLLAYLYGQVVVCEAHAVARPLQSCLTDDALHQLPMQCLRTSVGPEIGGINDTTSGEILSGFTGPSTAWYAVYQVVVLRSIVYTPGDSN